MLAEFGKAVMWQVALILLMLAFDMPAASSADTPPIVAVYPSGDTIPENLLRISMRFAAASARPVLREIALKNVGGSIVDSAFLEQELWAPDGMVLTALLDPGRVKTGLIVHDLLGRALVAGRAVELLLDGVVIKSWRVGDEKRTAPDPNRWSVTAPRAGTSEPLRVLFESPIDALAVNLIAVAAEDGSRIVGSASLEGGELSWIFSPDQDWAGGSYKLMIHPRLEDPCGNEVGEPFEQSIPSLTANVRRSIEVPFLIK
jgi:hypothetical protein